MSLATTPVLSRNAVVQVGGTAIGFLTDFTMDVKAEMIKEYVCSSGGSPSPAFTASGNQSYTFKASALYVPANYSASLDAIKKAIINKWGPNAKALWLCDSRTDAREHYGRDLETGKRTGAISTVTLPLNAEVISDLGSDGKLYIFSGEENWK